MVVLSISDNGLRQKIHIQNGMKWAKIWFLTNYFILTIEYSLRFQQNLSLISVITSVINSTSKRHPVSFDNIFKLISSSNIKIDENF